jgi:hypothetical protein
MASVDWRLYLPLIFILWLLAMLYVGPSYFRRLRQFIDRLKSHHESVFEQLGRPSLALLKMSMGSSLSTVWYVARKDYRHLSDDELIRLGDSVWIRLVLWVAGFVYMAIAFPIMATYQPY